MRTQYDDETEEIQAKKKPKRQRRSDAAAARRRVQCTVCKHPVVHHQRLTGSDRDRQFCHECVDKCPRDKRERDRAD